MIVWGFFSAMGWMGANYTVDKIFPEKPKEQVIQQDKKEEKKEEVPKPVSELTVQTSNLFS